MTQPPPTHERAIDRLQQADAVLAREVGAFHTLDPTRQRPTPLAELGRALLADDPDPARAMHTADVLARVAEAQRLHFPENLFWDFDYIAGQLVQVARQQSALELEAHVSRIEALQALFGCRSPIRFRYVTDFVYGLDWQRYVSADPQARAGIGPFDMAFLERVLSRGDELLAHIERGDDPDYPRLPEGAWRNPFGFSRRPEHELRLHRELAAQGLLPVAAWRLDAAPDWRRPYTRLRLEQARALGIPGDYTRAR